MYNNHNNNNNSKCENNNVWRSMPPPTFLFTKEKNQNHIATQTCDQTSRRAHNSLANQKQHLAFSASPPASQPYAEVFCNPKTTSDAVASVTQRSQKLRNVNMFTFYTPTTHEFISNIPTQSHKYVYHIFTNEIIVRSNVIKNCCYDRLP